MSNLGDIDLTTLSKNHKFTSYIETGTGQGKSLKMAVDFGFKYIESCDILEEFAKNRFCLSVSHSDSITFLKEAILQDGPTLFWLDACFPYTDMPKTCPIYFPLPFELEIITTKRDFERDVIACGNLSYIKDVNNPFYDEKQWKMLPESKQISNYLFSRITEPLTFTHTWVVQNSVLLFLPRG